MYRYAEDYGGRYDARYRSGPDPRRGRRDRPYDRLFYEDRPAWQRREGARGWGFRSPEAGAWWRPRRRQGRYGWNVDAPGRGAGREDGGRALASAVDTVRVAEIMTRNPEAVTPDTAIAEVARRMRDLDVGVIPIIASEDSAHLEGVVTDRDIAVRAAAEGKDTKRAPVREIMSSDPHTVSESDHVRDVFDVMKRARVRRVPVVSSDGMLVGIVAQADLAVSYAGLDLQRETEVEEVIEKISEPARPRWGRESAHGEERTRILGRIRHGLDIDLPDLPQRVRSGWRTLRREARDLLGRRYDRGWR